MSSFPPLAGDLDDVASLCSGPADGIEQFDLHAYSSEYLCRYAVAVDQPEVESGSGPAPLRVLPAVEPIQAHSSRVAISLNGQRKHLL